MVPFFCLNKLQIYNIIIKKYNNMEDTSLERIAIALEKIAMLMENSQRREINITKKERVAESKAIKSAIMEQMKKDAKQRLSDKTSRQSSKK